MAPVTQRAVWCVRGMQAGGGEGSEGGSACVRVCVSTLHLNHTPDYACLCTVTLVNL